jgi:hypothetical protein
VFDKEKGDSEAKNKSNPPPFTPEDSIVVNAESTTFTAVPRFFNVFFLPLFSLSNLDPKTTLAFSLKNIFSLFIFDKVTDVTLSATFNTQNEEEKDMEKKEEMLVREREPDKRGKKENEIVGLFS